VVSVTDPYGRILDFIDRSRPNLRAPISRSRPVLLHRSLFSRMYNIVRWRVSP
jgi:hypothetical protein